MEGNPKQTYKRIWRNKKKNSPNLSTSENNNQEVSAKAGPSNVPAKVKPQIQNDPSSQPIANNRTPNMVLHDDKVYVETMHKKVPKNKRQKNYKLAAANSNHSDSTMSAEKAKTTSCHDEVSLGNTDVNPVVSLMRALQVNTTKQQDLVEPSSKPAQVNVPLSQEAPIEARIGYLVVSEGRPSEPPVYPEAVGRGAVRRPPKIEKPVKQKKENKKSNCIVINNSRVDQSIIPLPEGASSSTENIDALVQTFKIPSRGQQQIENQRPNADSQQVQSRQGKAKKEGANETQTLEKQNTKRVRAKGTNKKPVKRSLHVTGIPLGTTEQQLVEAFAAVGPVHVESMKARHATVVCASQAKRDAALLLEFKINRSNLSVQAEKPYGARLNQKEELLPQPQNLNLSGDVSQQLDNFLASVRMQPQELHNILELLQDVEATLRTEFIDCEAMPFGSLTTGLAVRGSDVDCYVELKGHHKNHEQRTIVSKANKLFRRRPDLFSDIIAIPMAHTPIVKLFHRPTNTPCDVTFKTRLGIRNSELVAHLLQRDPRFPAVALLIKYWASVHDFTGAGKLSNYAITMLIVFYLQQQALLRPIADMQNPQNEHIVDGWNTAFDDGSKPPDTIPEDEHSVHSLVGNFFGFYAEFDFDSEAICPFIGRPIKKSAFRYFINLPKEYEMYKNNLASGMCRPLRMNRPLVVQDPFEQCQNVASAVTYRQSYFLQQYFSASYECYLAVGETPNFLHQLFSNKTMPPEMKINFHPEDTISINVKNFNKYKGWLERTVEAVMFALQNCLLLDLEKLNSKIEEVPFARMVGGKYSTWVEYPYYDREEFYKEPMVANMNLVNRERLVSSQLLAAGAARGGRGVWLQLGVTVRAGEGRGGVGAELALRLLEGDPHEFYRLCLFVRKHVMAWIQVLMFAPREAGWLVEPLALKPDVLPIQSLAGSETENHDDS